MQIEPLTIQPGIPDADRFGMIRLLPVLLCALILLLSETGCILFGKRADQKNIVIPDRIWIVDDIPLADDRLEQLSKLDSLLIMIPGVSSGDFEDACSFLEQVRVRSGHELALLYDWKPGTLGRKIVSPGATEPAAERLIALCNILETERESKACVDLLAHSAGTVVVNKAAIEIVEKDAPVRFRHVLLLGTALDAAEPLDKLKAVSTSILNLHSAFDKINRNINDRLGLLSALDNDRHRNLRMDHSLSGRIMRHYVFLSQNPENWLQYGEYLARGTWPEQALLQTGEELQVDSLHRMAQWVKTHPDDQYESFKGLVPRFLKHPDVQIQYYGVIIAGLLGRKSQAPALKAMLDKDGTPVFVRKEIYQALGNLRDGRHVDFLRHARDRDPECSEEIRDVVRSLKRQRIVPIR